jgi:uncharacterized MAPEG superfamily protein
MDLTVHFAYPYFGPISPPRSSHEKFQAADQKKKGWLTMTGSLASGAAVEISSVVFAALLVWASALVQHLTNTFVRGIPYVLSDRSAAPEMSGFYGRSARTLSNNMESALMFIPPTLLVIILGKAGGTSYYCAYVYIVARAIYSVSYWLAIPGIRSFAWLTGMICSAVMYYLAAAA